MKGDHASSARKFRARPYVLSGRVTAKTHGYGQRPRPAQANRDGRKSTKIGGGP